MVGSLIYSAAPIYEGVMRLLYGCRYDERFRSLAELIAEGSSVLDVCCGPGTLYQRYLKAKRVRYTGLDINRHFTERLSASGAIGITWDLNESRPLPRAEYVVIQSSLYHFLPNPSIVIERMIAAAEKQVLIAEPIRNLADSRIFLLAFLARKLTNPGTGDQPNRFNEAILDALMEPYRQRGHAIRSRLIAGGREKLYILDSKCGGGCSYLERDGMVKSPSPAVFPTSRRSVE
jgi:SAM-dependent methyltransferase